MAGVLLRDTQAQDADCHHGKNASHGFKDENYEKNQYYLNYINILLYEYTSYNKKPDFSPNFESEQISYSGCGQTLFFTVISTYDFSVISTLGDIGIGSFKEKKHCKIAVFRLVRSCNLT